MVHLDRLIPKIPQDSGRHLARQRIIVEDQHDLTGDGDRVPTGVEPYFGSVAFERGGGKVKPHRGTLALLALNVDVTTGLPGETKHMAQSKPEAVSRRFGRNERLKRRLANVVWHAGPVIRHGQKHVPAVERPFALWSVNHTAAPSCHRYCTPPPCVLLLY